MPVKGFFSFLLATIAYASDTSLNPNAMVFVPKVLFRNPDFENIFCNTAVSFDEDTVEAVLVNKVHAFNMYSGTLEEEAVAVKVILAHETHEFIITRNIFVDVQNKLGFTLMHFAVAQGREDVVEVLLQRNADVDLAPITRDDLWDTIVPSIVTSSFQFDTLSNIFNVTPLHLASKLGHYTIAKMLIQHRAKIDVRASKYDSSPLHEAVRGEHNTLVGLLVANKADMNITDSWRSTPLHLAASKGQDAIVKYLVDRKANIHIRNKHLKSPLHLAAREGYKTIVEFLVSKKAHINSYNGTPLHLAVLNGHQPIVEFLVSIKADVNRTHHNKYGNGAPLYLAVKHGHNTIVQILVANKADPNIQDYFGKTPIHAMGQTFGVIKFLVHHKANINIRDKDGLPPFVEGLLSNKESIVGFFMANQPKLNTQHNGIFDIDVCLQNGMSKQNIFTLIHKRFFNREEKVRNWIQNQNWNALQTFFDSGCLMEINARALRFLVLNKCKNTDYTLWKRI